MKTKSLLSIFKLAAAVLLAVPLVASATILATNTFEDNTLGALSGQGGGFGWGANWGTSTANVVDTTSSPLSYAIPAGATINGQTRALEVLSTSTAISARQLAAPLTQTFYVGYLARVSATTTAWGGTRTFGLHLGTDASTTTTGVNFGLRGNTSGVRQGTAGAYTSGANGTNITVGLGTTYYLVVKLNWNGTAFGTANMWLNPDLGDDVTTPNGDASLTIPVPFSQVTHVFFRHAALVAGDVVQGDELKIGTAWNDVVPSAGPPLAQVGVSTSPSSYIPVTAQTITAGNSITVYAVELDGGGNYVANTPATWSPVNVTGGLTGSDFVPANGGRSAVFTGHLVGTGNLRATPPTGATVYNDSGLITVQAAAASQVRVETQSNGSGQVVPPQSVAPGGAGTLTAYAISRDVYGNFLGNISATWSLENRTGGVLATDLSPTSGTSSTFTGNLSGTAIIRATSAGLTSVDSGLLTVSRAITWVGGGSNPWDFSTANWTTGTPVTFLDSDDVTFDVSGSTSPNINITTTVKPHSMNVTSGPYTFGGGGGIAGVCAVTNSSGTRLTFLTTNTYTGPTYVIFNSELQLGNGVQNGSLGSGSVSVQTGGTSPIFNRTDTVSAPYVASNVISGTLDFTMDFRSGATELRGSGANNKAKAVVRNGATLILSGAGTDLGAGTVLGGFGATNLIVEAGGVCKLGLTNAAGDHLTAAGRYVHVDGIFDANGSSEAFGILVGSGALDNTGASNAVFTIMQASSDVANGGIGNGGEIYTWSGPIRNTGAGTLGITKDGTNTLILANANTYGGDTRVIAGGILELGNVNSMQNSTYDQRTGDTGNLSFGNLTSANLGGLKAGKVLWLTNTTGAAVALTIGGNGQNNTFSGVLSGSGSLIKTGSGTQTLSGTNTYAGTTTVSLGTLLVNGRLDGVGAVSLGGSGTLGGTGTIAGAVSGSGTIRPGNNAIGKLTVNNTVTLTGSTVMEISRTTTTNSDNLTATSIVLGGTLTVTNLTGTLKSGNTFQLFSGALSGAIAVNPLPALWPGLTWNTTLLNSAGSISVAGTQIPPVISSVSSAGGNLTLSGSGGLPGATYYVVSTNNVAAPLANWPRISTNVFAADGNFTNTIPISLATPQAYFGIQAP
jgi:autotransporter-associated beta strand protein